MIAGSTVARTMERCAALPSVSTAIKGSSSSSIVHTQKSHLSSGNDASKSVTSDDNHNHFGVWQPNQTTIIFQRMEETCPDVMKSYARCVIDKQNNGALIQGACEEQFQAVMKCFRSVR